MYHLRIEEWEELSILATVVIIQKRIFLLGWKKYGHLEMSAIKMFCSTSRSHPLFCFLVCTSVWLRDVIMYAFECLVDCRECVIIYVHVLFSVKLNTKKIKFVNSVHHISNIIPLLWVFIQNLYRDNYIKILCYFFCCLSCRRKKQKQKDLKFLALLMHLTIYFFLHMKS